MRTEIEIWKRRGPNAAAPAVLHEGPAGYKPGLIGKRQSAESVDAKVVIKFIDRPETGGNLSINDGIDCDIVAVGRGAERRPRPGLPDGILGQNIDDDVGIDEDHDGRIQSSSAEGPRINATISSVVILKSPRPRRSSTSFCPLVGRAPPDAGLTSRTTPASISNVTSVPGIRPARSRTSCGMVT
jgi:hypothetical protein